MSRTVELPDDIYQRLEEVASAAGTTPAEWIAARLPKHSANANVPSAMPPVDSAMGRDGHSAVDENSCEEAPKTLADRMAGRIGLISSGRSDLSERVSEIFLEGMLEKRRMGTL